MIQVSTCVELLSGPLKAVILMTELAGRQGFKTYVVLRAGRGDDDGIRLRVLENNPLEHSQTRRVHSLTARGLSVLN